jgi:hypothetical protein
MPPLPPPTAEQAPVPPPPPPPPSSRTNWAIEGGYGVEHFFGLDFRRYDVGLVLHLPPRDIDLSGELRLQPGETESGLRSYRTEVGCGVFTRGLFRVGGGIHFAYTMVLRETDPAPVLKAIFGNIAGIGLGAHAGLGLALSPAKGFAIVPGIRGTAEVFNGGQAYGASGTLALSFE